MAAQPAPRPSRDSSSTVHAMTAFAVAVVIAGGCLAWALLTTPAAAFTPVAAAGTAAAVMVVATVTAAVYYASVASRCRAAAAFSDLRARRIEDEFSWLAEDTLPIVARRARDGATPAEVFEGIPRPETEAVRALLTTTQRLVSDVMSDAAVVRHQAEEVAMSARWEASGAHERAAAVAAELAAFESEVTRLDKDVIPAVMDRLRAGEQKDELLAEMSGAVSPALAGLFGTVATELAVAERRAASAMAACANAAARIQAQTTRMLADLREMEHQYGDDKVFGDLMALDHLVSQMGRLADSIALLSGGRTGRRWTRPIPVESILRGAMSRIDAYQRVRVHSTCTSAIAGYAAEGVMHALAELMDNATAFSAHGSAVHVYAEEEDAGLVVTIEDSGLGMRARERDRAGQAVSRPLDLATLPGTRLGLAVVGRVAARYGLTVSFRPSARGGTGVLVMIPRPLISQPKAGIGAGPAAIPAGEDGNGRGTERGGAAGAQDARNSAGGQPAGTGAAAGTAAGPDAGGGEDPDSYSLPVRPRGRTLADAPQSALGTRLAGGRTDTEKVPGGAPVANAPAASRPGDAGSRFAAFRSATGRSMDGFTGSGDSAGPGSDAGALDGGSGALDAGSDDEGSEGTA